MTSLCIRPLIAKTTNDNYETPLSAWCEIAKYIPNNKIIYDPFYCNGLSGIYMRELFKSNKIIHTNTDFFEEHKNIDYDVIISNPPFSSKIKILNQLKLINKPFMILIPVTSLASQYIYKIFNNELQILIPSKRIQFILDGNQSSRNCFSCIWIAWKMELKKDINYL